MQKFNNDLRYLIQFLDARYNDLWLYLLQKKTLFNQFNDMEITAEVKLVSALTCIKEDNSAALREKIS